MVLGTELFKLVCFFNCVSQYQSRSIKCIDAKIKNKDSSIHMYLVLIGIPS